MTACASQPASPNPHDLLRQDLDGVRRRQTLQRLGAIRDQPDPAAYAQLLYRLVASDSQPDDLRNDAIDRLIIYNEQHFRAWIDQRIIYIDRWPVLEHLFDSAVQRRWSDFVPTAVLSFARPSRQYSDEQRPERRTIEQLRPKQSLAESVFAVFDAPGDDLRIEMRHRAAAWTLLFRLVGDPRPWLEHSTSDAMLNVCLRRAARTLDELPNTAPSCSLLALAMMGGDDDWPLAHAQRKPGLAMRHAPLFVADVADQPVDVGRLSAELVAVRHCPRLQQAEINPDWSEDFAHWQPKLAPEDVALIDLIHRAMSDPGVEQAWFAQADADLADDSSEYGGALEWSPRQGVRAVAFDSDPGTHDHEYVASSSLLLAMMNGAVHYHFHAQSHHNSRFAGPGLGDLAFADRYQIAAVVLTFIDEHTLNVDYYQPGGVVIDLGCITR